MGPHSLSFAYYLRRTTRSPIYVPPLCWSATHLKLLRVAIETSSEDPLQRHSGISIGPVNSTSTQEHWATDANDGFCEGDLLPNIIKDILKSIEEIKGNGMSTTLVQGLGRCQANENYVDPHGPRLSFAFSNSVTELTPEIVVITATTRLPFLLYSTRRHTNYIRKAQSLVRSGSSATKKLLRKTAATKWHTDLDPFDVACLIAMAQEQRSKLSGGAWGWVSNNTVYTVYLITPNNHQSLHLFTARIPTSYLDALGNIDIEVTDHLPITHETIPIPSTVQASNILVDRITEIVELVYPHHQILDAQETSVQDGWDLCSSEDAPDSDQADQWGDCNNFVEKLAGLGL